MKNLFLSLIKNDGKCVNGVIECMRCPFYYMCSNTNLRTLTKQRYNKALECYIKFYGRDSDLFEALM